MLQGGGTRICCVLQSSSAVKILTEILLLHYIDVMTVDISTKILLDHFDCELQRDIMA